MQMTFFHWKVEQRNDESGKSTSSKKFQSPRKWNGKKNKRKKKKRTGEEKYSIWNSIDEKCQSELELEMTVCVDAGAAAK